MILFFGKNLSLLKTCWHLTFSVPFCIWKYAYFKKRIPWASYTQQICTMNHDTKSLLKSQVCSTFFIIFIGFHLIVGGIRYNPLTFIAITSSVNEFKQTIYVDNINRLFIVSVSSPLSMVHSRSTKQHHWWPRMFDPVYFSRSPFVTMDFHYYLDGKEEG